VGSSTLAGRIRPAVTARQCLAVQRIAPARGHRADAEGNRVVGLIDDISAGCSVPSSWRPANAHLLSRLMRQACRHGLSAIPATARRDGPPNAAPRAKADVSVRPRGRSERRS